METTSLKSFEVLINVVVIKDNVIESNFLFTDSEKADKKFKDLAKEYVSDWDTYSEADIDSILDNGYVEFPDSNGSVCISWPELEENA